MKKYLILLLFIPVAQADDLTIRADVWTDNWFAFYLNDQWVTEDSVPITTERSFNKESFTFSAQRPFTLNFVLKDFKENNTGLEYIGTHKQQMGDGGFIAQFTDANTGQLVAATSSEFRCLAIHRAPLNKSCEKSSNPNKECGWEAEAEPKNWKGQEQHGWLNAVEYSERTVRPKGGYDQVRWHRDAKLIWSQDLEIDNTLLCQLVVN